MIIYGPCINPLIRIAGHIYELRTTLYDGEYAVIDSSTRYAKDRKIVKVKLMEQKKTFSIARIMRVLSGRRFRPDSVLCLGMERSALTSFFLMKGGRQDGLYINGHIWTGERSS